VLTSFWHTSFSFSMCRWHSMNRREKCRCISLFLVALLAIAGVTAMIYGSVKMFNLSQEGLASDGQGVDQILSYFVKCSDEANIPNGAWSSSVVSHAVKRQCMAKQLPTRMVMGFAEGFMILALLCAPCAFKKDKMFGFTLWSTLAIATILMSVTVLSIYALPAAASFADCRSYDAATIQELQQYGIVCVKGPDPMTPKTNALQWICKLHTFYAGAATCVGSLLILFMIKHCCCCNPNAQSCCSSSGAAGAEHRCFIRRAMHRFRARFCRRSAAPALSSEADRDDGVPVSAPSYYEVNAASNEGASEDAGAGASNNNYYGVN